VRLLILIISRGCVVSNAAKPAELKRALGNPGKRALPDLSAVMVIEAGIGSR